MVTLNVRQARQEIRLDESEDSPVYTVDLTDSNLIKAAGEIYARFLTIAPIIERMDEEEPSDEDMAAIAEEWEAVIVGVLGQQAYDDVVEYVGGGADRTQLNFVLAPLALYLIDLLDELINSNLTTARNRYVRAARGADAL